jgi:prepilin signal peptidase PulO-like enzyme (type II secretory pathway)
MIIAGLFILISVYLSILDIRQGTISRLFLWSIILAVLIYKITLGGITAIVNPISGLFLGIGVFLLVFFISGKKLGLADVWYAGLVGMVLGPLWWYPAIFLSCMFGLFGMLLLRLRSIPFIPFMAAGSIFTLFLYMLREGIL